MKTQISFITLFIIILNSCNLNIDNKLQNSDVGRYLKEIHKIKLNNEKQVVIFFPASTCGFCKEQLIAFLSEQQRMPKNTYVIIAGANNAELSPLKIHLKNLQKNLYLDKGYQYNHYTSFRSSYPFYVYLDDKHEIKQFEINASKSKEILPQLQTTINSL
jgi:thiol-disulfide isomerase/thioredoxin